MIYCVQEHIHEKSPVFFIDTALAMTDVQRAYADAVALSALEDRPVEISYECSIVGEDDDEIARMLVSLPQYVNGMANLTIK